MQVHVRLPGEPHPTAHLQAVPGAQHRRLVREELGRGHLARVPRHRRRVDRRTGHLRPHQHPRAQVLDRLERPDRLPELLALARVPHRQLHRPQRAPELQRGRQQRPRLPVHRGVARHRHPVQRSQRVHRTHRLARRHLGRPQHRVRLPEVGHQRPAQVEGAHHRRPRRRPRDHPGGQVRGHQRARHQRPSGLLEDQYRLRHPQAHTALGFRQAQREEARPAQLPPQRAVHARTRVHRRPQRLASVPARQQVPYARPQVLLVLGRLEVHAPHRPFGRPRIRSATMFRWICEVPAAIVYEREESRSRVHSSSRDRDWAPRTSAAVSYSSWRACE